MQLIVQYMIERGYTRKGNFLFTLLAIGSGAQDALIWESRDETRLHILKEWKLHVAFVLQNLNKLQVKNAKLEIQKFLKKLAHQLLSTD